MNTKEAISQPIEVVNRLATLGLTRELLQEVIDRMVLTRRGITENHPPGSSGWMSWSEGTCRLREVFLPMGWERNADSGISSIHKDSIRVAVCNTDDGTGTLDRLPQNRSKKGSGTEYVVSLNQGVFAEILAQATKVIQMPNSASGVVYWYLCVYCSGETVRAELSCPLECENGFFKSFRERIILMAGDDGDDVVRRRKESPDGDSEFQIEVLRKQA